MKKLLITSILLVFSTNLCFAQSFWEKRRQSSNETKGITPQEQRSAPDDSSRRRQDEPAPQGPLGTLEQKKRIDHTVFHNPNSIFIPVKYGDISEIYNANPVPARPSKKLIINIQDVHCHYEAQKQIAHMLEELIINYGITLVLVEGNSKDASLAHLRKQASRARRLEVGEDYLKRGMISGQEFLDLVSDYDFRPLGIEDRDLYLKNLDSFLAIDKFKTAAVGFLNDLGIICENLKDRVFNKELKEMTSNKRKMEDEKLSFDDYCRYILGKVEEKNVTLPFKKPNFEMVIKTIKLASEINFETVNRERNFVIDELSRELPEETVNELLTKARMFRNNQIKQSTFYNYLQELLLNKQGWEANFPELAKYIHYTNLHDTIDVIELFIEIDKIESAVKEKVYKNNDERRLDKISKNVVLLSEIISLESAPYKYEYFLNTTSDFSAREWVEFIERLSSRYRLSKPVPKNFSDVDDNLAEVKNFYSLAYQRDAVFVEKTKKHLADNKQNTAIMITGGFHSKHVSQLFKKEGYSYMIISPKITTPVDQELYESVLKYKSNLIQR